MLASISSTCCVEATFRCPKAPGGALATPTAALSGPIPKALGFAGDTYLRTSRWANPNKSVI